MAMSLQEQLRAQREATERSIRQRNAQASRGLEDLEARGRKVYADAIRTGKDVVARTPAELRALGLAAATGQLPAAVGALVASRLTKAPPAKPQGGSAASQARRAPQTRASSPRPKIDVSRQFEAGLSGAVDEFSFGLADRAGALFDAAVDGVQGDGEGILKDYRDHKAIKGAEDAYDSEHYRAARNGGRAAGFVGSLAVTGGLGAGAGAVRVGGALGKAIRAANATNRIKSMAPGGLTVLATGGGAISGVAGQAINDVLSGQPSSGRDYVAAGIGGALGGLALRAPIPGKGMFSKAATLLMPQVAGAVEGGSTAALQSALNRREMSALDLAEASRAGAVGAGIGDLTGRYVSNALPSGVKGTLGEELSKVKSFAAGEGVVTKGAVTPDVERNFPRTIGTGPQRRVYLPSGRYTVADQVLRSGKAVEAKFGAGAELSRRQQEAFDHFEPRGLYRVDHWLPTDIGRVSAVALGGLGAPWEYEKSWPRRAR
jgi:hypothetical protein